MGQKDVTLRIEGINQLRRALEKLDDGAAEDFKQAAIVAGEIVAREAKRQAPSRTGALRDSIKPLKRRTAAVVKAGGTKRVPYAPIIHFGWGTRNIRANEFMYRAVDRRGDEALDAYLEVITDTWNREVIRRGG